MNLNEPIVAELQIEAGTTRRMLERLPENSLAWKAAREIQNAGGKSELISRIFRLFIANLNRDEFDRHDYQSLTDTVPHILETFDRNISRGLEVVKTLSDERTA
jgi:hypothetical protein